MTVILKTEQNKIQPSAFYHKIPAHLKEDCSMLTADMTCNANDSKTKMVLTDRTPQPRPLVFYWLTKQWYIHIFTGRHY